jgi:tetratricopeptide (TPR) repeat protein
MKVWLLTIVLLSLGLPGWHWLTRVRDHNAAQARGQAAAARGQAAEATYYFGQAVELAGRGGPAPALLLSQAQAQVQAGQLPQARRTYAQLLGPAVPAPVGSAARQQLAVLLAQQGQTAQAMSLLRQALRLDARNAAARYNYEVLSQYLAGQRPPSPPPAADTAGQQSSPPPQSQSRPDSAANDGKSPSQQPAGQPGTTPNATRPEAASGGTSRAPTPAAEGQPDRQRPTPGAGNGANGSFQPGTGPERPLPTGTSNGSQRGLGPGAGKSAGRSQGTQAATDADAQLQTQRERLKAMNLSPAQAQQLLEALRASEQQYLQQRPRVRQGVAPAPGTPTW